MDRETFAFGAPIGVAAAATTAMLAVGPLNPTAGGVTQSSRSLGQLNSQLAALTAAISDQGN